MNILHINFAITPKECRIIKESLDWWLQSDNDLEDDEIIVRNLIENLKGIN